MIKKEFILKLFEGFSIERWTDLVRPFDLIEMDKSSEKMVIAYMLAKFEEHEGKVIDWQWLMYASLFEILKKIALCDIKSPLQRRIKHDYPEEYEQLNEWVLQQYKDIMHDEELFSMFSNYIRTQNAKKNNQTLTERIFTAAHKYSAFREFEMLAVVNEDFRLKNIQRQLNGDIQPYLDLKGLQLLLTKQRPYEFLMVIEQLRFQARWNQTPRVPKTTVLGHSFFVALLTLLLSRDSAKSYSESKGTPFHFCEKRVYNNYFSALFHDLPEAVTRDIISPVKQATDTLSSIVKQIEADMINEELIPLMEKFYVDELIYFTDDEFENRIQDGPESSKINITYDDLNEKYNEDAFSPVDGKLVRCADHIAAFVEAHSSINHGITSIQLTKGKENLNKLYQKGNTINGIDVHSIFTSLG